MVGFEEIDASCFAVFLSQGFERDVGSEADPWEVPYEVAFSASWRWRATPHLVASLPRALGIVGLAP
jgi:hypothetical protein